MTNTHCDIHLNLTDSEWFLHIVGTSHHYSRIHFNDSVEPSLVHREALWHLGLEAYWCYAIAFTTPSTLCVLHLVIINFINSHASLLLPLAAVQSMDSNFKVFLEI
jgi:hypothetical protein